MPVMSATSKRDMLRQVLDPDPKKVLKSIEVVLDGGKGQIMIAGITAPLVREKLHD